MPGRSGRQNLSGAIDPAQIEVKFYPPRRGGYGAPQMETLFGGMPEAARFVFAFMLVLGLIGAGALLWRKFGVGPLAPIGPRSRQPRLAVIDAASVDARRQLVLIRRDNTEHLLMIGGPTDIVIEPNITRAGAIPISREPRPIPGVDASRHPTSTDQGWALPLEPAMRPLRPMEDLSASSEPPPRTAREAMVDSMRALRSEAGGRRNTAPELRGPEVEATSPTATQQPLPAEASFRAPAIPEPRRAPPIPQPQSYEPVFQPASPETQRPPTAQEPVSQSGDGADPKRMPPPSRPPQSDENNLAEMAQRLEAALRRPTKPVEPAPPPAGARQTIRSDPSAARKAAYLGSVKSADPVVPSPPPDLKILPGKPKTEPEPPFESLEEEMAKMLGRSPGKS
jgi:flagellar protein FliO/FliZ